MKADNNMIVNEIKKKKNFKENEEKNKGEALNGF